VAIWYFEEGNPHSPFFKSLCRSIKVFGSLAFGSLILTIVIVIRWFLMLVNVQPLNYSEIRKTANNA
jgi:hypothetical protein